MKLRDVLLTALMLGACGMDGSGDTDQGALESKPAPCPVATAQVCTSHTALCQSQAASGERLGAPVIGCSFDAYPERAESYLMECVATCEALGPQP